MIFDITNPDSSYVWLHEVLGIPEGYFIEDYILNCNKDIDTFISKYKDKIFAIDINKVEFAVMHVTSNSNCCKELRKDGIKNLKEVLLGDTEMRNFLEREGITFDIKQKKMYVNNEIYNIDYDDYLKRDKLNDQEKILKNIARKIYFDFQINGFFFSRDVCDYGTQIDKRPEFLLTLSELNRYTFDLCDKWIQRCSGYVVKYKANFREFKYYSFYEDLNDYINDSQNGWWLLKKWMILHAIESSFMELYSDIYAYMESNIVIGENQFLECITIDEWRRNAAKYFK